jgi:cytosine/creatinine deaminase
MCGRWIRSSPASSVTRAHAGKGCRPGLTTLEAARKSLTEGGILIGAAIARDGVDFATGHNERGQTPILSRREMSALRAAGRQKTYQDTTLTLAPYAMCAETIIQSKIPCVVVGEARPFDGELELLRTR